MKDFQLIARVLGFLENPPAGPVDLGIVYPAASVAGKAEALQILALIGNAMSVGGVTLRPQVVAIEEMPAKTLPVLILTAAAFPQAGLLAQAVAGKGILTIATDADLVDRGLVVMAVRSQPRVEVFVSRVAARSAAIGFAGAFRMMIQER